MAESTRKVTIVSNVKSAQNYVDYLFVFRCLIGTVWGLQWNQYVADPTFSGSPDNTEFKKRPTATPWTTSVKKMTNLDTLPTV